MLGARKICHFALLAAAVFSFLFLSGCGSRNQSLAVNISPKVKMKFYYIEPLKIYVGKYEVSNREFRCFRGEHSSGSHESLSLDADNQPVVNVNWNDASGFCEWMTKNFGSTPGGQLVFRLPTEKEWETYATSGKNTDFPWGDWPPPKNYNYYGRENRGVSQKLETADGFRVSCPVRKSGANEWGLYGVGGNVWEWCQDKEEGQEVARVFKGASWADCAPIFLSTTRRRSYAPTYKHANLGFRVVAGFTELPKSAADAPAGAAEPKSETGTKE